MEKNDRALARQIIKICRAETKNKHITERSKLHEVGIDSITFVNILFSIETIEGLDFSADLPLLSECETIYELIKKVQIIKFKQDEGKE
jgi:acyl carrier protein